MSDEIWKERFTQAGRVDAWHKKGTHFDPSNKDLTLADVIKEAGADFTVEVRPLTIEIEAPNPDYPANIPDFDQLPDERRVAIIQEHGSKPTVKASLPTGQNALVRMPHIFRGKLDGAAVLGTGSDRYVPVQNSEIAAIFENVAKVYRPETCGVLQEGKIFFLTLNAGQFDVRVNGQDDAHNAYVYLFDQKVPGAMLTVGAGSTRVVCYNTYRAAQDSARILIPLQHDSNINAMITEVAKALQGLQSAQQALRDAFQMMANKAMSASEARSAFEIAWPTPKLSQTMTAIMSLDTSTNPVDSPNQSQIDQVANALSKLNETKLAKDRVAEAEKALVKRVEFVEYLRETAESSLMHMADTERLGINGYTVLNAVSETLEHRADRVRGDVAADMLIGTRADVMDRVSKHLIEFAQN